MTQTWLPIHEIIQYGDMKIRLYKRWDEGGSDVTRSASNKHLRQRETLLIESCSEVQFAQPNSEERLSDTLGLTGYSLTEPQY